MKIETKFSIGDKAWVPKYRQGEPDEPMKVTVGSIQIEVTLPPMRDEYQIEQYMVYETGIISGNIYTLGIDIFENEEECRAFCNADFIPNDQLSHGGDNE